MATEPPFNCTCYYECAGRTDDTDCPEHGRTDEPPSCGNVKVCLRPFGAMWATCRHGVFADTFLAGAPCPHHEAADG